MNHQKPLIKPHLQHAFLSPTTKKFRLRLGHSHKLTSKTFLQRRNPNSFYHLPPLLKHQKFLFHLNLHLDWKRNYLTPKALQLFAFMLKNFLTIKSLSLNFTSYGSGLLSVRSLSIYKPLFQNLRFLTELKFDFSETEIYQDDIYYLVQGIKSIPKLQVLKINFSSCLGVTDKAINYLKKLLNRCSRLRELKLDLSLSPSFSKRRFHTLCNISLPQLQVLDLRILRNSDPYSIGGTSRLLSQCKNLQELSLCISRTKLDYLRRIIMRFAETLRVIKLRTAGFEGNEDIAKGPNKENSENPFGFLSKIKHLKRLDLDFSHSKMSSQLLVNLMGALKGLTSLEGLGLNIYCCEGIEEKNNKYFGEMMESMGNLKEFSMIIGANSTENKKKLTDKYFQGLHAGLLKLKNLQKFRFECWHSDNITDNTVALFESIISQQNNLVELNLGFRYCTKLTDKVLKPLGSMLGKAKELKKLGMDFSDCPKMTGECFVGICDAIKQQRKLEALNVNLSKTQVNDKGIHNILSCIGRLKDVEINVERCVNIKNVELVLGNLEKLERVELNFSGCHEIPAKQLKDLGIMFEHNAKNMTEFNLSR